MTILGQLFGIKAEPWQQDALCAQVGGDAWYPEKGESTLAARIICLDCPIRTTCLREALDRDERFGVWGGYSERQRRRLKRGEAVALATRPEPGEPMACAHCGEEFAPSHATARYCTKYCSRNAHTARITEKRRQAKQAAA